MVIRTRFRSDRRDVAHVVLVDLLQVRVGRGHAAHVLRQSRETRRTHLLIVTLPRAVLELKNVFTHSRWT